MKLDPDCIRDILLTVEENTGYNKEIRIGEDSINYELLKKYDNDKVMYHIIQSEKSGLIDSEEIYLTGYYKIRDLTPQRTRVFG